MANVFSNDIVISQSSYKELIKDKNSVTSCRQTNKTTQ